MEKKWEEKDKEYQEKDNGREMKRWDTEGEGGRKIIIVAK